MGYSIDSISANCYPGTSVLINKFDICATNILHSFREGNGRTQRVFLTQLIRNAGCDINFFDMDTDLLMIATIQSAQGVTDLLRTIFQESIF